MTHRLGRFLRHFRPEPEPPTLRRPTYAGRHEGATFFVLGNGSSLGTHREPLHRFISDTGAVVLGANHIKPFTAPDYHAFTNRKRFSQYVGTVDVTRSRLLVGVHMPRDVVRSRWSREVEYIQYVNDHEAAFDVVDGVIQTSCRTVSVLLIGVALVMGARQVYVAGLDGFPPPQDAPLYHAPTSVLKDDPAIREEVHRYTVRFLAEIRDYLRRNGRSPFAIVTPTMYEEHYRPELLVPYGA